MQSIWIIAFSFGFWIHYFFAQYYPTLSEVICFTLSSSKDLLNPGGQLIQFIDLIIIWYFIYLLF
jgi:hypothetical protein